VSELAKVWQRRGNHFELMIVITRDKPWAKRLSELAGLGGWPLSVIPVVPKDTRGLSREAALIVLDRSAAGASIAKTVSALRLLYPNTRMALAFSESELGIDGVAAGVVSGADDVLIKTWSNEKLLMRFSSLHDSALSAGIRLSEDGNLKIDKRSRRVYVRDRGRWKERAILAVEFSLLYALLSCEGQMLSREHLVTTLGLTERKDLQVETVARRIRSLRTALAEWSGEIKTLRGGFYRLTSSRRRSTI
jgi:DNA-binding response OmpR family regulator